MQALYPKADTVPSDSIANAANSLDNFSKQGVPSWLLRNIYWYSLIGEATSFQISSSLASARLLALVKSDQRGPRLVLELWTLDPKSQTERSVPGR